MIAKRIAVRACRKSSFGALVAYITGSQGKVERLGECRLTNFENNDIEWAVKEALAVQSLNTRATSDKTYHLLIGFAPGESPSSQALCAMEDRVCAALGYSEHQRISAVHRDTDCLHIHIAINKIHPQRLTLHEPHRDYRTLGETCAKLEEEFGLQKVDHSRRNHTSKNLADDLEHHAGVESLLGWIKSECLPTAALAKTWAELHETLAINGLRLKQQGNGLIIESESGVVVKASSIAREFSKPQLEKRLGAFEPQDGQAPPAARSYQAKPLRSRVDTAALYGVYQVEQQAMAAQKSIALKLARQERGSQVEAAKRSGRLRRMAIKLLGGAGANKRVLYALANRSLLSDLQRARERQQQQRIEIVLKHERRAWLDWLRVKAIEGHPEALAALRGRKVSKGLQGDTVSGHGSKTAEPRPMQTLDGITKQGTAIQVGGHAAIRDDGSRLMVSRGADRESLTTALQLTASRYGNQISVNGSAAFQGQVAVAAAIARLPITFADAKLERQRQALVHVLSEKEFDSDHRIRRSRAGRDAGFAGSRSSIGGAAASRSAGKPEPYFGETARRPPPEPDHRLRNVSELDVVRVPVGAAVLLPGDVPHQLEHRGTHSDTGLRRSDKKPTGADLARAAAARYVAERQSKRSQEFDISNHSLYTGGAETTASYEGTRIVDGQGLVLLRQADGISVMPIDGATVNRLKGTPIGQPITITPTGSVRTKGRGRSR